MLRWDTKPNAVRSGFTLLELLIVISIIALLSGLLLPALGRSKSKAQGIVCLNHVKQLALAAFLYSDDTNDRLVYNLEADARQPVEPKLYELNWVNNIMNWELDPGNTNLAFASASPLGRYVGGAPSLFKCPSDRVLSSVQKQAGWSGRVRSFSMNAMTGDAGPNVKGGQNLRNPGYRQFLKLSDIPHPSRIFFFIDEHPDSISDGYFLNKSDEPAWIHLPASYHNGAASLSFSDGHAESHRWSARATRAPPRPESLFLPMPIPDGQQTDFQWIAERSSVEP